jgi:hypothetical protein
MWSPEVAGVAVERGGRREMSESNDELEYGYIGMYEGSKRTLSLSALCLLLPWCPWIDDCDVARSCCSCEPLII